MISTQVRWYEPWEKSPAETLHRVWDVEDCKDLVSRKMYYYSNGLRETELSELWVSEPENVSTASYGSPWGFYVGMDSIRRYYLESYLKRLESLRQEYAQAGKVADLGTGESLFRAANTPTVYIAEDGKTAQGTWFIAGEETFGQPDGTARALHIFGRIGVDFKWEADGWKIWHWFDNYQMTNPVGEDIESFSTNMLPENDVLAPEFTAAGPDIAMQTHFAEYHDTDGWPPLPCAHETYNLNNSYAPEGHPALRKELTDVNWAMREAMNEAWGRAVEN